MMADRRRDRHVRYESAVIHRAMVEIASIAPVNE